MWARDVVERCGGELSGYQPLGYLLAWGFAPRPVDLFSCKAPAMHGANTLLCTAPTSALTKSPNLGPGVGRRECDEVPGEGSVEEQHCSPLPPVFSQRAARSRAWCLRGGSSSSAPCSPSIRADTLAWRRARAPRHARTSWCWCEVGLPQGGGGPCRLFMRGEPSSLSSSSASFSSWHSGTPDRQRGGPQRVQCAGGQRGEAGVPCRGAAHP